jgi:hypothetical protein
MNVVSKTHGESMSGAYVSPEVKVVLFQSEGVLCASLGSGHDGFDYDEPDDL